MTRAVRNSTVITTASAIYLLVCGLVLLFASDNVLPLLVPGVSSSAAILGQLIASGWLAVAWINWLQRGQLLGGIYGRTTVLANFALYLIGGFSLARAAMAHGAPLALQAAALMTCVFALVYGALMQRGPFGSIAEAGA